MSWKDLFGRLDKTKGVTGDDPNYVPPIETKPANPETNSDDMAVWPPPPPQPEVKPLAAPEPPGLEWWFRVDHRGHPAFYLRTLMPGDFAPGRLPAPRHIRLLERPAEGLPAEVTCGTCGEVPRSEDLDVVERSTGSRGFLAAYTAGRVKWPPPTSAESCWMCSNRKSPAIGKARLRGTDVLVCAGCAKYLNGRA